MIVRRAISSGAAAMRVAVASTELESGRREVGNRCRCRVEDRRVTVVERIGTGLQITETLECRMTERCRQRRLAELVARARRIDFERMRGGIARVDRVGFGRGRRTERAHIVRSRATGIRVIAKGGKIRIARVEIPYPSGETARLIARAKRQHLSAGKIASLAA